MTLMTRSQWLSHAFAAFVALVIAAPLTFFALDRDAPIVVINSSAVSAEVAPGDELRVLYTISRRRICSTVAYPVIHDGKNIRHVFQPETLLDPGDIGREAFTVRRRVPNGAAEGEARYRVTLAWQCPYNLFHKLWPIVGVLPEVPFMIVEEET